MVVFSLPRHAAFVVSGYLPSFTDAFFETMSGFTTTGATVINDVEALQSACFFCPLMGIGGPVLPSLVAVLPLTLGASYLPPLAPAV